MQFTQYNVRVLSSGNNIKKKDKDFLHDMYMDLKRASCGNFGT